MRSLRVAFGVGATDIVRSFRRITLWAMPGWFDFILGYRRTLLGPFWETVAMALWIGGLGVVFSYSLGEGDTKYMAYVGVGGRRVVLHVVADDEQRRPVPKQRLPHSQCEQPLVHICSAPRRRLRGPFVVAHAGSGRGLGHVGMALAVADSALGAGRRRAPSHFAWMAALIGLAGARFADTKHGLSLAMRFLFFATPVFWRADALGDRSMIAMANPFTHFLEVVRAPLLGEPVSDIAWTVVLATSATGIIPTVLVYGQYSRRLVFWL